MKRLITICLFSLLWQINLATHIVGGEIYYECLGNNDYLITLKLYRDCLNGQAPFDPQATVSTYDTQGNLVRNDAFVFPGSSKINTFVNDPCYSYASDICVEEAIYSKVINLPPTTGGYHISYQRCCRNSAIINLQNPASEGATYTIFLSEKAMNECNSSPSFKKNPPMALCLNQQATFDFSATDRDGDSLVYEFYTPFHGGGQGNTGFNSPMPNPAAPPPYQIVVWKNGYNQNYQIDATPAFSINPATGIVTGNPNTIGQYVIAVKVSEYRNGQLLSENRKDFQFQTVVCHSNADAGILAQNEFCKGLSVSFSNTSAPATSYLWNFGDPSTNQDTSSQFEPTYTYPDTGKYTVMLIAFPGYACADTTYQTIKVNELLEAKIPPQNIQCLKGNSFNFLASGFFGQTAVFNWNFTPEASVQTSTLQNPSNISFAKEGHFMVLLTVQENGCTSTDTQKVSVYPNPVPKFSIDITNGCAPHRIKITDESYAWTPLQYFWQFADSLTSTSPNPIFVFQDSGIYSVSLTIKTTSGCIDTAYLDDFGNITVNPQPNANFTITPQKTSIFKPEVSFYDKSENGNLPCIMDMGDGTFLNTCQGNYQYLNPGAYTVKQIKTNQFGCSDTLRKLVIIEDEFAFFIPNAFTPNGDGLNDSFFPTIYGITDYTFLIFDRWGQLIFESNQVGQAWDGTLSKKTPAQNGQYIYLVKAVDYLGNNQLFKGVVYLAR